MNNGFTNIWGYFSRRETRLLFAIALISLSFHLFLVPRLNIVEDESAYMQDAAQITAHVLPLRDFGGTKGPVWLFLFRGWQMVFGQSIMASRLFSSLAHVVSIFLIWHLSRSFRFSKQSSAIVALLWGLSAVVVSLSTNITHIPLELLFVLAGFLFLRSSKSIDPMWAALFLWAALLMRATAIAFAPAILFLLLTRSDRWPAVLRFCLIGLTLVIVTVTIVYPLYGWPKTAFFFNADATLIATKQRAIYSTIEPVSPFRAIYNAMMPLRKDGISILIPALFFPVVLLWRIIRKKAWPKQLTVFLFLWLGSFILFYKGWGRTPTPFYPLESIPALCLAAGFVLTALISSFRSIPARYTVIVVLLLVFAADLGISYYQIPLHQYRGTVEVRAAEEVAAILKQHVPPSQTVFTGQPVYAYLAGRRLYGGYTHPGWYLSERAGYLPSAIRRVFYPDFDTLSSMVEKDVFWIVVDWRTNDIFFNSNAPETGHFRSILAQNFESIATVSNPASRDIVIYRRK